jgi:hypothetical protein
MTTYSYTTIEPGSIVSHAYAINTSGQIVGDYYDVNTGQRLQEIAHEKTAFGGDLFRRLVV